MASSNKDVSIDELVAAIRARARGDTWLQPPLTALLRRGVEVRSHFATPTHE